MSVATIINNTIGEREFGGWGVFGWRQLPYSYPSESSLTPSTAVAHPPNHNQLSVMNSFFPPVTLALNMWYSFIHCFFFLIHIFVFFLLIGAFIFFELLSDWNKGWFLVRSSARFFIFFCAYSLFFSTTTRSSGSSSPWPIHGYYLPTSFFNFI